MALFTPEVVDIGGSNVRPYSPPVVDYSGIADIGRILASAVPEKPKMSAAERESIELQPLADIYAMGEEIRAQKGDAYADAYIKMSKISFAKNNPNLSSKIKSFEDTLTALGVEENVYETQVKSTIDVFTKTKEGALKNQVRLTEYTDNSGNVDIAGYRAALFADALEYNAQEASLARIQNEKLIKEDKENKLITNIVSNFKNNVDAPTNAILRSNQGLAKTLEIIQQGGADTPEAMVQASQMLLVEESSRKATLKAKLSENGIIKTDAEIDNLMKQANPALYYSINALEGAASLDKKYLEQMDARSLAIFVSRVPSDSPTALTLSNPEAMKLFKETGLITTEIENQMKEDVIKRIFKPDVELLPLSWMNVNVTPTTLPENYSPSNTSSRDQAVLLDMFTPETRNFVKGASDSTKEDILVKTKAYLDIYKKGDVGTKIPGNIQAQNLSSAYAVQVIGTELETDANSKNINLIFGDKALTFINDMMKEDPTIGASLNKNASVYAQYEASKQIERFGKLYVGQIQNDLANSPFILEEEGNVLNFKVRPEFENDKYIKLAKGSKAVSFGKGGPSTLTVTETVDPYTIFSRWSTTGYTGVASATTTDQSSEMVAKIKNIQLLYQNSFRLEEAHGKKVREVILRQSNFIGLR